MRRVSTVVTCLAAAAILLFGGASAASATSAHTTARSTTSASGNLIVDPGAEAGYCTADWHAATTVPGWTVLANSPDVMCYSAGTFTQPAGTAPGTAFFAPGDQGDAVLAQTVNVSSAATSIDTGTTTFSLSGLLGGWTSYAGYVRVSLDFRDGSATQLGTTIDLPTVSAADRHNQTGFLARATTGTVPAGTRSIVVRMAFVNSTGESGYADNLSLTLDAPVAAPVLAPPPSTVSGYDHVFVIMMENSDYSAVLADTTGMPYLHGLMSQGTSMSNYHAVYHPSDENYLAVAGGDTYAHGAIYWPNITAPGTNLADELEAHGKTWKAYEQGMGVPCNASSATEHTYDSYYAPDDAPFINYTDVGSNTARCQAHLVDTNQLATDLAGTATTPAFSWIAADDYYDGEASGNGNATSRQVQDGWLKQTITPIMASPAWRTQRSLLVITWDEDESNPDNHVATVVVGSQGTVPAGYTDPTRYDHYSTARTIENALGLPPITANDRYATPFGTPATSTLTTSGSTGGFQYATAAASADATNWIGIYPAGATPGVATATSWQYAPNPTGTVSFSGLAAGSYYAWYCYANGYAVLAGPVPFTVSGG